MSTVIVSNVNRGGKFHGAPVAPPRERRRAAGAVRLHSAVGARASRGRRSWCGRSGGGGLDAEAHAPSERDDQPDEEEEAEGDAERVEGDAAVAADRIRVEEGEGYQPTIGPRTSE